MSERSKSVAETIGELDSQREAASSDASFAFERWLALHFRGETRPSSRLDT
jgi:hypothetical protein